MYIYICIDAAEIQFGGYVYIYLHRCIHVHVYIYLHIFIYICTYIYINVYMQTYIYKCIHATEIQLGGYDPDVFLMCF
jgi:hypothetical protein